MTEVMEGMEVIANVHQLKVGWGNAVLLIEDEVILIDTGPRGNAENILDYLAQLGYSPSQLTLIIITHCHRDHFGSLYKLRELTGASIAIHRSEAVYLRHGLPHPFALTRCSFMQPPLRFLFRTIPLTPDILLEDDDLLSPFGGLRVLHTPGHTPGNISLYSAEKKLLIVGDTIVKRCGKLALPPAMPRSPTARESVRKLSKLDFDVICFGHGQPIKHDARERVNSLAQRIKVKATS